MSAPPSTAAVVRALVRKDLLVEVRTKESIPAMALFSITTFVIFHFGLDRNSVEGNLAAGVFWVTLLLAAMLGVNRLFVAEREQGGFDGFLLAPVDRTALLIAKGFSLFSYLAIVELVAVPGFAILLLEPPITQALPELLATLFLANLALAVIGTLVSAIAIQTRARDLIVPLLALPLLVPVVIAASRSTAPLFAAEHAGSIDGSWLLVLALYDVVFGLIAFGVFDFLLED